MKAFDLLDLIFKEDLRNDTCGVVHGSRLVDDGWKTYFGFGFSNNGFEEESDYFYMWDDLTAENKPFPLPNGILYNAVGNECISLWKIEI